MNKLLISILFIIFGNFLNAQTQNILFIGGIAHIGNGTKIDNSAIAINNGKFTLVSKWNSNIDKIHRILRSQVCEKRTRTFSQ